MKFFDCNDGTIINLEQLVFIDVDERMLEFSNGYKYITTLSYLKA